MAKESKALKAVLAILAILIGYVAGFLGFMKVDADGVEGGDVYVSGSLSIHFLELGSYYTGDCTLVKVGDTEMLIDAGAKTSSIDTLDAYIGNLCEDGKLEYVIVTHAHEDHYACFTTQNSLFNRYEIGTVIDFSQTTDKKKGESMYKNYQRELGEAVANGATHYTAKEVRDSGNYVFPLSESVSFTVLDSYFYYNVSSTENNHSVCTLITQNDNHFLFTGDLEKTGEEKLVEYNPNLPKVKLFKAGHHGSQTSSNDVLLDVIQPEIVCVCCCAGSDQYNAADENKFPTQAFIDRVSKWTSAVYVTTLVVSDDEKTYTSMNGNIVVTSTLAGITVECSNNNTVLKDTDWFKNNRTCPDVWKGD